MAHDDSQIRPETYALDELIRQSVARARRDGAKPASDALLFLGNRHLAFPSVVIQDPVLEPVDKLVWMVICQSGCITATKAVFPSYDDISRLSNISSTATISRAIAILRATRWLSLCGRCRDAGGRFGGNVYALHDEPLPLADALHLDPGYMAFLREAKNHHHARVRRVAAAVSESLDDDIGAGKDVLAPENPIQRRLEALHAIHQGGGRRYFSFGAAALSTLSGPTAPHSTHRLQYSKAVDDPQNSKAVRRNCSSSNIYTTTTTTTTPKLKKSRAREAASLQDLILPSRLKDNQRELAARYLAQIPPTQRQAVLDELEGRLQAEQRGAKPIYDELRYLHRLCLAVNRGSFHPNLGLKVQAARDRMRRDAKRSRKEAAARECERKARAARTGGTNPLAELRKHLRMPPSPTEK